jgi:uncharacterized Zn finger protein
MTCPACGNADTITTTGRDGEYVLECGDCGEVW